MKEILSIVKELQAESSKTGKVAILKQHKDNEQWKKFLKYVLDEKYVYGIQSKKLNKFLGKSTGVNTFTSIFEVFEYLLDGNNTGDDTTVNKVAAFIDSEPVDLSQFYVDAITKKLRMGIDSTVNKTYGKGFLSEFKVMLAKDFYKETKKVEGKEFVLTEKLDGQRLVCRVKNGTAKFYSRTGQEVDGLIEIESEMLKLPDNIYDGEVLIKNEHLYSDRDVLQETLKISRKKGIKNGLNYWVFDSLPIVEFDKGQSSLNYNDRRLQLEYLFNDKVLEHVLLLPILYEGDDMTIIPEMLKQLEDEGKEGLMLNRNLPYSCKRSDALLKIKTMMSFDEICVDVFVGEGKYKDMLGGIIVNYKGYPLRCGSGFTDDQRKLYWNNPELIIGNLVEIQYFRESNNAEGGLSVSFPIFKNIRNDKSEVSYN